jgi:hypothetical protein
MVALLWGLALVEGGHAAAHTIRRHPQPPSLRLFLRDF